MTASAALQLAPTVPGRIHRAGFGWVNVGGVVYEHDRVIHQTGISPVWWRERRHWFTADDALAIVDVHQPAHLILGTGWMGMLRVNPDEIQAVLLCRGVTFDACRTPDAILLYQQLFRDGIECVVALHQTC